MQRTIAGIALVASVVAASPVAAQDAIEPASPWTLEGSEERCTLLRNFGTGSREVQLQIDSFGRYDRFFITLVGDLVPRAREVRGTVRYGFDIDPAPRAEVGTTQGQFDGNDYVQFQVAFRPADPAAGNGDLAAGSEEALAAVTRATDADFERRIRTMAVNFGPGRNAALALGNMAQPLGALRECVAELQAFWGLDPAQQKRVARFPVPPAAAMTALAENLPEISATEGVDANIPVRVMVDAAGNPSECTPQIEDVHGSFTAEICSSLSERFEPAQDEAGNAVPSFYQANVVYAW